MIVHHLTILVSLLLCSRGFLCSICLFHGFYDRFFTDLNYIIDDFDGNIWYVVAFRQPDLPYRTLYHLPQDIATNSNCYSYILRTHLGVILMELVCREVHPMHSFDIFTRPSGTYVTGAKAHQREERDFRVVHVLQLTKTAVLLVSCSAKMGTYGMLVLNREPAPAKDAAQVRKIIEAKLPSPLHYWVNYTVTAGTAEKCSCINHFITSVDAHQDKRKGFVLVTLIAAATLLGIVKVLKRLLV
uniref:Uncharacterized protein n=1 Tax=Anopheles dirus TaxID=7168 RepID=A0A182NG89_9DIPT